MVIFGAGNVALDVAGPGVLYFVRTNHWHGSPWHYVVDGVDRVITETSTKDPLHPTTRSTFEPADALRGPFRNTRPKRNKAPSQNQ